MSKIEYAKFQFMILVLKSLQLLLVIATASMLCQDANQLIGEIVKHRIYLENTMEEK